MAFSEPRLLDMDGTEHLGTILTSWHHGFKAFIYRTEEAEKNLLEDSTSFPGKEEALRDREKQLLPPVAVL